MQNLYCSDLTEEQFKKLKLSDDTLYHILISLISTFISIYTLGLKRKNILAPNQNCLPVDSSYIRTLVIICSVLSLLNGTYYYNQSKKLYIETKEKGPSTWLDYLSNLIYLIPLIIRIYILFCLPTDTTTSEEIIAED